MKDEIAGERDKEREKKDEQEKEKIETKIEELKPAMITEKKR